MNPKEKIHELIDLLNDANYHYYVKNDPVMSDYDFDMKLKELEKLEKEENYILPYSPTQRIGSDIQPEFGTVSRNKVMGSIANVYVYDELKEWLNQFDPIKESFIVEPKYDGTSCSIIYKNGVLVSASTRGNGYVGSDITENVKTIHNIPLKLKVNETGVTGDWHYADIYVPDMVEIRGEVLMPTSVFNELNETRSEQGLPTFANERNAAAGSLKQLDPKVTAERKLMFKPYSLLSDDSEFYSKYVTCQHNMLDIAEIFGFDEPAYWRAADGNSVISLVDGFENHFLNAQDYCMDGCVIKLESIESQEKYGYTQKVPRWAKAFKFKQEQASTKLLGVEMQIGMSGQISFVGILEPVEIDGSVISKVTLNNMDYIRKMDLHVNDYVIVQKNGAVIPGIVGVDYDMNITNNVVREPINDPTECPFCGGKLIKKIEDGAHYFCSNENCNERSIQMLNHFVKKECMNIDGLSIKTIRKLYNAGIVKRWQDIYSLTYETLVINGFGEKVSKNIIDQINASRDNDLLHIVIAIGIPMIGKVTAKKILSRYKTVDELRKAYVSDIASIDGVGEVAAQMFISFISDHNADLDDIKEIFSNASFPSTSSVSGDKLKGKRLIATGKLNNFTRDSIIASVESNGGIYCSSISSTVDYVIIGEKAGASKIKKANDLGLKTISEDEYLAMISV